MHTFVERASQNEKASLNSHIEVSLYEDVKNVYMYVRPFLDVESRLFPRLCHGVTDCQLTAWSSWSPLGVNTF